MRNARYCSARAKSTGNRCRAWAVRGERVCRVHGAGGGRPITHGRYSTALRAVGDAWRDELGSRVVAILRLGGDVKGDLALLEAFLDPPAQCRARSKQTRNRCGRRPTPGFLVCYYHGSRGGRRRNDGLGTFGRVQALLKHLDRQRARLQWRRLITILDGGRVDPPASPGERENARLLQVILVERASAESALGSAGATR